MKLQLIALGALLSFSSVKFIASAEETKEIKVKMPDEQTLKNHLRGFEHFVKETDIIERLANEELVSLSIVMILETRFHDYNESLKKIMSDVARQIMTADMKPRLYEALLQDNPAALDQLEKLGLYKNPKK